MKKLMAILLCLTLVFSLSLSAFAMDSTPSRERKDAPENVGILGEDGEMHEGIFHDASGEEAGYVNSDTLELVITSGSKRGSAPVGEITVMINVAEREINEAENVGELAPSMIEQLQKLKATSSDPAVQALEIEDFVVSDLFDISLLLNGEVIQQVPEGQTIQFRLQTDFKPGDVFYVLVNCDGLGWVLVDSAVVDENGVMTITASSLCAMAFVVPGYNSQHGEDDPHSPQTGYADLKWLLVAGGVCLVAATCAVVLKKKAKAN